MQYQGVNFVPATVAGKTREAFIENNFQSHFTGKPEDKRKEWLGDVWDICTQEMKDDGQTAPSGDSSSDNGGINHLSKEDATAQLAEAKEQYSAMPKTAQRSSAGQELHARIGALEAHIKNLEAKA